MEQAAQQRHPAKPGRDALPRDLWQEKAYRPPQGGLISSQMNFETKLSKMNLTQKPFPVSRMKKILFAVILIALLWVVTEFVAAVGYFMTQHTLFSPGSMKKKIQANLPTSEKPLTVQGNTEVVWGSGENTAVEVIHPYFGYVSEPGRTSDSAISDFGFPYKGRGDSLLKRSPDKRIIGIFGGSFAGQTYSAAHPLLEDCLKLPGKEVVVLNFAAAGYKQPQQWLVLAYLLALGAEFDIIINIDGFNEVAIPPTQNIPHQVNPFYPRQWDLRTAKMIDAETVKRLVMSEVLKENKSRWAAFFYRYKLYYSPTLSLLWQYRDRTFGWSLYQLRQSIQQDMKAGTYAQRGPRYTYESDQQMYEDLVGMWQQCSLQMKKTCEANKIQYYHFLQPNQYVADSKPMTSKEKKIAMQDYSSYGRTVIRGYPLLRQAGERLSSMGVNFVDLTMIFARNEDTLYVDDCCHLNETGYELIGHRICDVIRANNPP